MGDDPMALLGLEGALSIIIIIIYATGVIAGFLLDQCGY
jgi:hypothetical protein